MRTKGALPAGFFDTPAGFSGFSPCGAGEGLFDPPARNKASYNPPATLRLSVVRVLFETTPSGFFALGSPVGPSGTRVGPREAV